jgi:hypothetical protein
MTRVLALLAALALLAGCPGEPGPAAPRASIRLVSAGPRAGEVVACVASLTGYDPTLARKLVERAPVTLPGLTEEAARDGARALTALGAEALVQPGPP